MSRRPKIYSRTLFDCLVHIISSHKHDYFTRYKAIQRISSQNPHLYQRDIEKIVSAILDEIVEALRRGDRVELRGFGAFSAKLRGARQGRNPRTGAVVPVAQKAVPSFKTGKDVRKRLNPDEIGGLTE